MAKRGHARLRELQGPIERARANLKRLEDERAAIWREQVEAGDTPAKCAASSGVTPAAVRLRIRKTDRP